MFTLLRFRARVSRDRRRDKAFTRRFPMSCRPLHERHLLFRAVHWICSVSPLTPFVLPPFALPQLPRRLKRFLPLRTNSTRRRFLLFPFPAVFWTCSDWLPTVLHFLWSFRSPEPRTCRGFPHSECLRTPLKFLKHLPAIGSCILVFLYSCHFFEIPFIRFDECCAETEAGIEASVRVEVQKLPLFAFAR